MGYPLLENLTMHIAEDSDVISFKIMEDIDNITMHIVEGGGGALPYYNGEYIVQPEFEKVILQTKNKSMRDDVQVLEIPISEVGNEYGTTLIIGG